MLAKEEDREEVKNTAHTCRRTTNVRPFVRFAFLSLFATIEQNVSCSVAYVDTFAVGLLRAKPLILTKISPLRKYCEILEEVTIQQSIVLY